MIYLITDIHDEDGFYGDADLIGRKITFIDGPNVWKSNTYTKTKGWTWSDKCKVEGRPDADCFHAIKIKPLEIEE